MAGVLSRLAGLDTIREDMKKRVDEILKAGNEWQRTAEKLTKTIQTLIETIEKGNPKDLQPIKGELKKLTTQTRRLAKAFQQHRKTLNTLARKL